MKHLLTLSAVCVLVLSPITPAQAQEPAAGLDPTLAALTTKYEADTTALKKAQETALIALRAPYLTALSAAEQKATTIGDAAVLKALLEEKQAVNARGVLLVTPAAALPRTLNTARNTYIRETARIAQALPPREKALQSAYIRDLGALEQRAQLAKNMPLITQIGQEKLRLIGQAGPAADAKGTEVTTAKGQNAVVNGDFSQGTKAGVPRGWKTEIKEKTGGKLAVLNDGGNPYCQVKVGQDAVLPSDGLLFVLGQELDVNATTTKVSVSVRLRCSEIKASIVGSGKSASPNIGIKVVCDSMSKETNIVSTDHLGPFVQISKNKPEWETYKFDVPLKPGTTKITVWLRYAHLVGICDVDDVEVKFR